MTFTASIPDSFNLQSQFICDYWTEEDCDVNNWNLNPSTFDVKGVTLVGAPHMRLWSDLNYWKNPGRAKGISLGSVQAIMEDIRNTGIDRSAQVVYYDIDTHERINGMHRQQAASELGIPGWMMQGVSFESVAAKIEFATVSNNIRVPVATRPSIDDVTAALLEIISSDPNYFNGEEKRMKITISNMCKGHLSNSVQTEIFKVIVATLAAQGNSQFAKVIRYVTFNDTVFNGLLERSDDEWFTNYYDESSGEISLYVNMLNFSSRVGTIVQKAAIASALRKPIHFVFSVDSPNQRGQETLQTKRAKVFSEHLRNLENNVCTNLGMNPDMFRHILAWNHPDAQHRFVPQDTTNEDMNRLIDATPYR